jgi:hypothetical protein
VRHATPFAVCLRRFAAPAASVVAARALAPTNS